MLNMNMRGLSPLSPLKKKNRYPHGTKWDLYDNSHGGKNLDFEQTPCFKLPDFGVDVADCAVMSFCFGNRETRSASCFSHVTRLQ